METGALGTIEVTPEAAAKLIELRGDDPRRALLRLYVMGRTCCSYQYGLAFDATAAETDLVREVAGIRVAVDDVSAPFCDGATIEWVDGEEGTGFLVRNASLGGTCGCRGG